MAVVLLGRFSSREYSSEAELEADWGDDYHETDEPGYFHMDTGSICLLCKNEDDYGQEEADIDPGPFGDPPIDYIGPYIDD